MNWKRLSWMVLGSIALLGSAGILIFRRSIETSENTFFEGLPSLMPIVLFGTVLVVLIQVFRELMDRAGERSLQKGEVSEAHSTKHRAVDAHRYRPWLFNVGLAISLGLTLMAFEWKSYDEEEPVCLFPPAPITIEDPITIPPVTHYNPPPPPPQEKSANIIEVDDEEVIADVKEEVINTEVTEDTKIPDLLDKYGDGDEDEEPEEVPDDTILQPYMVEKAAEPHISMEEFLKFVYSKIKYTKAAKRARIEGRVTMSFVIEKDGSISNLKSLKPLGYGLDEEVVKAIQAYPHKWTPARQRGRTVRMQFMVPVMFKLNK